MTDWSDDIVLRALQDLEDPVGSLVRAFPGRARAADNTDWIREWFVDLAQQCMIGAVPDPKQLLASAVEQGGLSLLANPPVEGALRVSSILPRHFRGFRDCKAPIQLGEDLVVIEGRNSSGKTSLSEAIEWVLTGHLSRRESGEHGHPTELANCIGNEFRPNGEQTSVELLVEVNGNSLELRRVLLRDYTSKASDEAESTLFLNGRALSKDEEDELRKQLLAGVHPILMQHNLRRFVHDDPNSRRQYFERLLQIDELTALVEKAVVGPTTLKTISNPDGGTGLTALRALVGEIEAHSNPKVAVLTAGFRRLEKEAAKNVPRLLSAQLVTLAREAFPKTIGDASTLPVIRDLIATAQRGEREQRLPLLAPLAEARGNSIPSLDLAAHELDAFKGALEERAAAREAAGVISDAQKSVAGAMELLRTAGLIDPARKDDQKCPVCEAQPPSLRPERIGAVSEWTPLAKALDESKRKARDTRIELKQSLRRLRRSAKAVAIPPVDTVELDRQLKDAAPRVATLARSAVASSSKVRKLSADVIDALDTLTAVIQEEEAGAAELESATTRLGSSIEAMKAPLVIHREDVASLEEAVGAASRDDSLYRMRDSWLETAGLLTSVAEDVGWEAAKAQAKESLDRLRAGLIELRTEIIEYARRRFSKQMTEVWGRLRSDSGAKFSRLKVPPARGRGYKLEFELKAVISDGTSDSEVDALRVFSESQVNVVGLAAYITRAELLGHRLLIFDDPVQSMDEEHFCSFASSLITNLLDRGFQIIILTHSDTFARRIQEHHYRRESYATLETKPSRRRGCYVEEGSRRISERLKKARKLAEEGELPSAWRLIRLAIERLYTLVYASENPDFDPQSWRDLTAEDMWNKGAGDIITSKIPESDTRLREILTATGAGAHDKAASSETDIVDATKYLAKLLSPLRLGAG